MYVYVCDVLVCVVYGLQPPIEILRQVMIIPYMSVCVCVCLY
jgi:hypothetical protein